MVIFEHRRYPALTLQDEKGIWAQFDEEKRTFGEHVIRVGVLSTQDPELIARLRAASDPDLFEVGAGDAPSMPESLGEVPEGSIATVLAWVNGDRGRAERALTAEQAKGDKVRSTLLAELEQLTDDE